MAFLFALAESLAVVGLVVPGAAVMIVAGALIAMGGLHFWPVLLLAVAGAILGDGVSFWLGHRYRDQLRSRWPFYRHPAWLARGERFFYRHGGKSILFGRFVGPVRPIVPLVAGMLGMRAAAFYTMNVLSAMLWAPAPGAWQAWSGDGRGVPENPSLRRREGNLVSVIKSVQVVDYRRKPGISHRHGRISDYPVLPAHAFRLDTRAYRTFGVQSVSARAPLCLDVRRRVRGATLQSPG